MDKVDVAAELLTVKKEKYGGPSVVVAGGVCAHGVIPFHFVNNKVKINARGYQCHLSNHYGPECHTLYPDGNFMFRDDGATSHATKSAQAWPTKNFPECLRHLHPWRSRSPDRNPCDFSLWSIIEKKVEDAAPKTEMGVKTAIQKASREITVDTCARMFGAFAKRQEMRVEASGGVFKFKKKSCPAAPAREEATHEEDGREWVTDEEAS